MKTKVTGPTVSAVKSLSSENESFYTTFPTSCSSLLCCNINLATPMAERGGAEQQEDPTASPVSPPPDTRTARFMVLRNRVDIPTFGIPFGVFLRE
ncbi:hypothetical protein GOODEAATRI_003212 [Goodea atripinnis]|uniref:Uncharacterized protein n=1 Tax=Goodea atripinnis TaxID=208336 RepID=A0ABV0PKJ9_9TELE